MKRHPFGCIERNLSKTVAFFDQFFKMLEFTMMAGICRPPQISFAMSHSTALSNRTMLKVVSTDKHCWRSLKKYCLCLASNPAVCVARCKSSLGLYYAVSTSRTVSSVRRAIQCIAELLTNAEHIRVAWGLKWLHIWRLQCLWNFTAQKNRSIVSSLLYRHRLPNDAAAQLNRTRALV